MLTAGYGDNTLKRSTVCEWAKRFRERVQAATTKVLKALTKEDFQSCFIKWKRRWKKCIRVDGEYFEGDHIDVSD